jgi:hypothetical protein
MLLGRKANSYNVRRAALGEMFHHPYVQEPQDGGAPWLFGTVTYYLPRSDSKSNLTILVKANLFAQEEILGGQGGYGL